MDVVTFEGIVMVKLSKRQEAEAMRIHGEALVVDTHCDTLMEFMPQRYGQSAARKLGQRSDKGHLDLPRMKEGGIDCQTFAMYTGRREGQLDALLTAMQMTDIFYREMEENEEGIVPVTSVREILAAKEVGKQKSGTYSTIKRADFKRFVLEAFGLSAWSADRLVDAALLKCEEQPPQGSPLTRIVSGVVASVGGGSVDDAQLSCAAGC